MNHLNLDILKENLLKEDSSTRKELEQSPADTGEKTNSGDKTNS
jgi:hypothetical protein